MEPLTGPIVSPNKWELLVVTSVPPPIYTDDGDDTPTAERTHPDPSLF